MVALSFKPIQEHIWVLSHPVAKLENFFRGSEVTGLKSIYLNFIFLYKTGGSKTYIPKKFYTKRTYITLLSRKFGGSGAPPDPFNASPMLTPSFLVNQIIYFVCFRSQYCFLITFAQDRQYSAPIDGRLVLRMILICSGINMGIWIHV
ncbi:hypothetical protein Hanom_Chr11g01050641 [Helianthus anomalus]